MEGGGEKTHILGTEPTRWGQRWGQGENPLGTEPVYWGQNPHIGDIDGVPNMGCPQQRWCQGQN